MHKITKAETLEKYYDLLSETEKRRFNDLVKEK